MPAASAGHKTHGHAVAIQHKKEREMNKIIFCVMVLFLCGCQITSTPSVVYDCAEADKPAIADFVIKCASGQVTILETTTEYNHRINNCTEKAKQLFCRPITPKPDEPTSDQ